MRHHIINIIKVLFFVCLCPFLMGAHKTIALQGSSTIFPNPEFQQDYPVDYQQGHYIMTGVNYAEGDSELSYKMATVINQIGMFDSSSKSITFIKIVNVQGLPPGLQIDQTVDRKHPQDNTLFFYGIIPATVAPGVYTVTVTAQDLAVPTNFATQTINLHIASNVPQPTQPTKIVNGLVGQTPNIGNMSQFFNPQGIQQFRIQDASTLPPGISFSTSGDFTGSYTQAGVYNQVEIQGYNQDWGSPINVIFYISQPDSPPVPVTDPTINPMNVNANLHDAVNIANMSGYFTLKTGASSISSYRLYDASKLPPGVTFTPDGNFHGAYNANGSFPNVQVQAINKTNVWSDPFTINFAVAIPDSVPQPVSNHLSVVANINDPVASGLNVLNGFTLNTGASAISAYEIDASVPNTTPLPNGVTFTSDGSLHGQYLAAGQYTVAVRAENKLQIWSGPYFVDFAISIPDSPPTPALPGSQTFNLTVGEPIQNVGNMSSYFNLATGATAINAYQFQNSAIVPSTVTLSAGVLSGSFALPGTYTIAIQAENNTNIWSQPYTFIFNVTTVAVPPSTLTCPSLQQVITNCDQASPTVTVQDSINTSYQFTRASCQGFIVGFNNAELGTNTSYPSGLACVYSDSLGRPSAVYVLNPAPQNMYYQTAGNTVANCTNTVTACQFSIPH